MCGQTLRSISQIDAPRFHQSHADQTGSEASSRRAVAGGPPTSRQWNSSVASSPFPHDPPLNLDLAPGTDSAPYLRALVPISCRSSE